MVRGWSPGGVRGWDFAAGAQRALLVGGQRGAWLGCVAGRGCLHYDDGTLLMGRVGDSGRVRPIPPPAPIPVGRLVVEIGGSAPGGERLGRSTPATRPGSHVGEAVKVSQNRLQMDVRLLERCLDQLPSWDKKKGISPFFSHIKHFLPCSTNAGRNNPVRIYFQEFSRRGKNYRPMSLS